MRGGRQVTETDWKLGKALVLMAVFGTLTGFTVLSHLVSQDRAGRIACADNQRSTLQALAFYQADHAGNNPPSMPALRIAYLDPSRDLGRCPVHRQVSYSYEPATGRIWCPNPAHKP